MKSIFKIKTSYAVITSVLFLPLIIVAYFFPSQSKKEKFTFYKEPMVKAENDVWRLPIIEPYELITADCCTGWNFQKRDSPDKFSADSVSIEKDYILFQSEPNDYGFLDIKRKRVTRFRNYPQFADSLNAIGIKKKLCSAESVYKNWRETGQLPWAAEILAIQKGDPHSK